MANQVKQKSTANKMAITSLGLNVVCLVIYMALIAEPSGPVFAAATGGAFLAGVFNLSLGLVARKRAGHNFLTTLSMAVAFGYIFCFGIIILSLVVYWF